MKDFLPISRYFTFVLFSERGESVKQFILKKRTVLLILFFIVILPISLVIILFDYWQVKTKVQLYKDTESHYFLQKESIKNLNAKIKALDLNFERLADLDETLKSLTNVKISQKNNSSIQEEEKKMLALAKEKGLLAVLEEEKDAFEQNRIEKEKLFSNIKTFLESEFYSSSRVPSSLPIRGILSANFGYRLNPLSGEITEHNAILIASRLYNPVFAVADGYVSSITFDEILGNLITIIHGNGFVTRYGHLHEVYIEEGTAITEKTKIGELGNTGKGAGSHLYYQLLFYSVPINPLLFIKKDSLES